jgi:hypothetical protein
MPRPLASQATQDPQGVRPLSKRPAGYLLAFLGGFLAPPAGLILSPLALFALNKLMLPKDGKRPNRFSRWALIGCVATTANFAALGVIGGRMIESDLKACNAGEKNACKKLIGADNVHERITNPAFAVMLKEHNAAMETERLARKAREDKEAKEKEARRQQEAQAREARQQQEAAARQQEEAARQEARVAEAKAKLQARLAKAEQEPAPVASKPQPAEPVPYMLAVINNGAPVNRDDITIRRFAYILEKFSKATGETEQETGDRLVYAWKLIEKEYGRRISLLDYAERVRKAYASLAMASNQNPTKLFEFALAATTVSVGNE